MSQASQDEPVSLAPLTLEEGLRALLAVKPDDEPTIGVQEQQDNGDGH